MSDIESCTVHFSICKPLPHDVCKDLTNSSTCEEVILKDKTKLYYNIGDYVGNDQFDPLGMLPCYIGALSSR